MNNAETQTEKKKKGILAVIWESMTKTGGCCGPGESCCGSAKTDTAGKGTGGKSADRASSRDQQGR